MQWCLNTGAGSNAPRVDGNSQKPVVKSGSGLCSPLMALNERSERSVRKSEVVKKLEGASKQSQRIVTFRNGDRLTVIEAEMHYGYIYLRTTLGCNESWCPQLATLYRDILKIVKVKT